MHSHPNLDAFLAKLKKVRQPHPRQWEACCPAHDDANPSMSVSIGDDGRVVAHCHARRCPFEAIAAAVGMTPADLGPSPPDGRRPEPPRELTWDERVERAYDYRDERGRVLYQSVRLHSPKDFRQRHVAGAKIVRDEITGTERREDVWAWSMKGVRQVPYRLPELLASTGWVFVVEGEKDADNLAAAGVAATTNAGGAGKWHLVEKALECFRDRRVAIVPDHDAPGLRHAVQVAASLAPIAAEVRVVELPGLKPKGDASDWLAAGGTADRLMAITQLATRWDERQRASLSSRADELDREREAAKQAAATPTPTSTAGGEAEIHLTDVGNSLRFARQHRDAARYCKPFGTWLIWSDSHWKTDESFAADLLAKQTVRGILAEARGQTVTAGSLLRQREKSDGTPQQDSATLNAMDTAKALSQHAFRSESAPRIAAMLRLAQSEMSVTPEQLDSDPYLFNCLNGTIDLRSGGFRPHRREDYLTRVAQVAFDPAATCPQWEKTLRSIFPESPLADDEPGDVEMIAFVRRLFGMCLSGDVSEQVLMIFHGEGGNGKSLILETICSVLGPYAGPAPEGLLLQRRGEQHPCELADLFGQRLVHSAETGEGAKLDETRVKRLTGAEVVKGRFMKKDFFSFTPTHKLVVCTNHKPKIKGTDHAIWRRVLLVPFLATFWDPAKPPRSGREVRVERFRKNKELIRTKFAGERAGILNWLVAGFRDWQAGGLNPPAGVRAAVDEYQKTEDLVRQFMDECCELWPDSGPRTKSGDLYAAFTRWAEASGEFSRMSRRSFTERVIEITGFGVEKSGDRWLPGVTLVAKEEKSEQRPELDIPD